MYVAASDTSFDFTVTNNAVIYCYRTPILQFLGAPYTANFQNKLWQMAHFQNKIPFLKPRNFPTFCFPQDKAFSWCIQQEWSAHCSANEDTHDKSGNILMSGILKRWSSWLELGAKEKTSQMRSYPLWFASAYHKQSERSWFFSFVLLETASS